MRNIAKLMMILALALVIPSTLSAARPSKDFSGDRGDRNIRGTISYIDSDHDRFQVRTDRTLDIRITNDTDIRTDSGRSISRRSLEKGDKVRIEGYYSRRSDEFVAKTIRVNEGRDRGWHNGQDNDRRQVAIQVRVVRDMARSHAMLMVTKDLNNRGRSDIFGVEITKRTEITRRGRSIDVNDLREGDILTIEGIWNRQVFQARNIKANDAPRRDDWRH